MAQKKLLLILATLFVFCCNSYAFDDDLFAEIIKKSQQIARDAIVEKWHELVEMKKSVSMDKNPDVIGEYVIEEIFEDLAELKIFVSSSMGKNLLKNYVSQAKKYNATLVFNGLPAGSWMRLSILVSDITDMDGDGVAIQVDDEAFKRFGIKSVPSFVLVKAGGVFDEKTSNIFDKIAGNIGIRRVLEAFKNEGELSEFAAAILERAM